MLASTISLLLTPATALPPNSCPTLVTLAPYMHVPLMNAARLRPGERFQIQWQESGKQKWVKRFNLLFEDEKIEDFKSRIQAALRRRQEVERDARYKAYVDQQEWRNMDTLDQGFQERVMHLAGWKLPQKLPALTQSFLAEVQSTTDLHTIVFYSDPSHSAVQQTTRVFLIEKGLLCSCSIKECLFLQFTERLLTALYALLGPSSTYIWQPTTCLPAHLPMSQLCACMLQGRRRQLAC